MATLKGSTIASTFDQLVQRATSYSQTGTNIELMDDTSNAVAKPTGLYLESGATTSNVGIGIAAPERLLHLYAANSGVTPHANTNLFIEDSANNYLELGVPNGETAGIYFSDVASTSGSINYNHTTNLMTFSSDSKFNFDGGNVGIGTTTPDYHLEVEGAANDATRVLNIKNTAAGGSSSGGILQMFQADGALCASGDRLGAIMFTGTEDASQLATGARFEFAVQSVGEGDTVTSPAMTIDSTGNVGIGTSDPALMLDVRSANSGVGQLRLVETATNNNCGIQMWASNGAAADDGWKIAATHSGTGLLFQ